MAHFINVGKMLKTSARKETEKQGIGTTQQHLTIVEAAGAVASRSS
jgi:hypothetical protein